MNEEHTAGTPEEEQNSTNSQTLKGTPYKAFPTVMGMKEVIDKLVEIEARIAKLEEKVDKLGEMVAILLNDRIDRIKDDCAPNFWGNKFN